MKLRTTDQMDRMDLTDLTDLTDPTDLTMVVKMDQTMMVKAKVQTEKDEKSQ